MGKTKKDDVKEEIKEEMQEELVIEEEPVVEETETTEEVVNDEEPEVQTTFTDVAAEEMIDEEGSVENVSD